MRLALWFGIAAFLVAGGLFNAIAHSAESVLGLALMVGVAAACYGAHLQNEQEKTTDNPDQKLYYLSRVTAFHRIKDLLVNYKANNEQWTFTRLDPDSGQITATLVFNEQMAAFGPMPQLPNQTRRLTLNISLTSPNPGQTAVQLNWSVASPINRDNCDSIITHLTNQIDLSLTNQTILVS